MISDSWASELNQQKQYYTAYISQLQTEYDSIGGGYIVKNGKYFCEKRDGVAKGITRNPERINQLIRKRYLEEEISNSLKVLEFIENAIAQSSVLTDSRTYMEKRFVNRPVANKLTLNDYQRKSINFQSQNGYLPEHLTHLTHNGILVRSQAEQLWGNLYESMGIPYLYEEKITLDVTNMPDIKGVRANNGRLYKVYYPDFKLLLADKTFFLHEHLGRLNDAEYRQKNGERLLILINSGYVDPDRIIITTQKDIFDQSRMISIIEEKVLPYV